LPLERLTQSKCTIIGVGAIGRQVALQLAAMGVAELQLIDPDTVDEVNLGPQAYLQEDVGRPKVAALGSLLRRSNSVLNVEEVQARYARSMTVHPVVFCCVDSIDTRRFIWNALQDDIDLFIDGRMAAEVMRVLTVHDTVSRERYPQTLFGSQEALQEACTARSTVYCANAAAAVMVHQFTRWLRGLPTDFDCLLNLLSTDLIVS
jgi:sulfur carrier protein ThiS adenylyltransferase